MPMRQREEVQKVLHRKSSIIKEDYNVSHASCVAQWKKKPQ